MTTDRVTQVAAEAIVSTPSSQALRTTQVAVEVIVQLNPPTPPAPASGWSVGSIRIG